MQAASTGGGAPAPGIGTCDFGLFAARAESADARTFCARSNARSIPAALVDDSYLALSIFFSGDGTEIICACPGQHAIEVCVDARRREPLLLGGALRAVGEHLRIDPERAATRS